jgi:hypothetical protein
VEAGRFTHPLIVIRNQYKRLSQRGMVNA